MRIERKSSIEDANRHEKRNRGARGPTNVLKPVASGKSCSKRRL